MEIKDSILSKPKEYRAMANGEKQIHSTYKKHYTPPRGSMSKSGTTTTRASPNATPKPWPGWRIDQMPNVFVQSIIMPLSFSSWVLCQYWNAEYSNCGKPSRCYVWAARTSQATPRKTAFSFRLCKGYGWGHAIGISWKFCRLRYLPV